MKAQFMRRLAAGGSALLLAFGLTACDIFKKGEENQPADSSAPATTTTTSTTTTTTTTTAGSGGTASPTLPADGSLPTYGWVTASTMHIRKGPGIDYEVVGGTHRGERLQILANEVTPKS